LFINPHNSYNIEKGVSSECNGSQKIFFFGLNFAQLIGVNWI